MLHTLNPSQRDAVTTTSGPLLVLAGAGTGKTRVITYRMAHLIERGIEPQRILSVTFTNKAAKEMRERTRTLLGGGKKPRPIVSTFHSLCVRILRDEIEALGYPSKFAIYDRGDQEAAARTVLRDLRVGDAAIRPGDLINTISRWKTQGITASFAANHADSDKDLLCAMGYRKYQKQLKATGSLDFDDLLLLTRELFVTHPEVLTRQQERFDHVQIDEYQDTNGLQFQIVEHLVSPHRNLCVVGDDDQSIYGWRGAEVEHILNFQGHYPNAKVVRLQDNYRCTDEILSLANRLVKHNRGRHEKTLVAHKPSLARVRFLEFEEETQEAERVVAEINLGIQSGQPPGDFAILFRTNEQPRPFESELRRQQVPYHLIGGQSFYDRREIRDCMAYLKALAFPKDEVSLLRILNTPTRGIGTGSVEKVLARAVREKLGFFEAAKDAIAAEEIPAKAAAAITNFEAMMARYREQVRRSPLRLGTIASQLLREINYEGEIQKQYKQAEQQTARRQVLEQFIESLNEYTGRSKSPSLSGFLEETALSDRLDENDEADRADRRVKLMTLHSAKGLEFPSVYLVGLEEGLLPHQRSVEGTASAIDEERRLTYVGITRAMDRLTITRAAQRKKWGRLRPTIPSRFLFEMRGDEDVDLEDGSAA